MPGALIESLQDVVGSWLINLWALLTTTTIPQLSVSCVSVLTKRSPKRIALEIFMPFLHVLQHYNHTYFQCFGMTWLLQRVVPK